MDSRQKKDSAASVFFVRDFHALSKNIDVNILLALETAKNFDVDAVYFRFFNDGRSPLPQIYIYDNTLGLHDSDFFVNKHKDIWSSCNVPAFIVVENSIIKLYDTCAPIEFKGEQAFNKPIKTINFSDITSVIREFNASSFDNGTFWENKLCAHSFTSSKTASQRLVSGLKRVRADFLKETPLSPSLSDRLLIICILIKYLEETGVDSVSQVNLAREFFAEKTGFSTLIDIILNNKITKLLNALSVQFNGGIFNFSDEEKTQIDNVNLSKLAEFFEAEYKNSLFGWREYSFEYIPVELISNFYEEFLDISIKEKEGLKKEPGVVYTPSFLVNLLVDEILPLSRTKNLTENVKLIDPACGSGIFLATAFRRLVQRWRINNIKNGKLGNPNPKILKQILSENIFGVDKNENAVNLTIFSLQLALCSMLTPKQIWTQLGKFNNLLQQKNIRCDDFLLTIKESRQQKDFDLVIGNPPYIQNRKNIAEYKSILKWDMHNPQGELSLLFLEKAMQILKPAGKLCFLLPSGPLLYNASSFKFRKDFFSKYNVTQIIDLIYFRRILYNATIATLALFVENKNPDRETSIKHIVPKRTKVSKDKIFFELDHYDFHIVPRDKELDSLSMWKSNILGGYLVYNIAKKFTQKFKNKIGNIPNLKIYGSTPPELLKTYENISIDQHQYSLFNLTTEERCTDEKLWRVKKSIKFDERFPCEVNNDDKSSHVFAFVAKKEIVETLNRYLVENSALFRLLLAAISNRQAIRSPYIIEASDIKSLPYEKNQKCILDFISYRDRLIIDDFVKYQLESLGNGEKAQINVLDAAHKNVIEYSNVLCDELNTIYKTAEKEFYLSKCTRGISFYCCEYAFNSSKPKQVTPIKTTLSVSDILECWNPSKSCHFDRIVRIYGKDKFILLKPIKLRYWIKSMALYDFDEILKESINGQ